MPAQWDWDQLVPSETPTILYASVKIKYSLIFPTDSDWSGSIYVNRYIPDLSEERTDTEIYLSTASILVTAYK